MSHAIDLLVNEPIHPLIAASFEQSFRHFVSMPSAEAFLLKIFLLHANDDTSRICACLADKRALRSPSSADPSVLASAMGTRVRMNLLAAGAKSPPAYIDDFPSSPFMVNNDVCACCIAVTWPNERSIDDMAQAISGSLSSMFLDGGHFMRHLRMNECSDARLESQINKLMIDLRAARKRR
jgi:hypothetical protein